MSSGSPLRTLGFVPLFALALNGIVGVGIFFAPRAIAETAGPERVLAAFLCAALAFAPSVLVYARLADLLPEDGGPAAHARRAFGARAGFVVGAVGAFAAIASTAAVLRALGESVSPAAPRAAALGVLVLSAAVVERGLVVSARAWTALTALKVIAIGALVAAARAAAAPAPALVWPGFAATLLAAFCFQGFEITALVAGQGRASTPMIAAFACAAALYALLLARGVPFAAGGAGGLAGAVIDLSSTAIAFAMVAMTPRYVSAVFAALTERRALAWTAAALAALVVSGSLAELFGAATLAVVTQYAASALALGRLTRRAADRLLAAASLACAGALAFGATLREVLAFVAVVFAASALSRTVTGKSPTRHAPSLDV